MTFPALWADPTKGAFVGTTKEELAKARIERERLWAVLQAQGGRGVDLAEQIDYLDERIAVLEEKIEDAAKDNYR